MNPLVTEARALCEGATKGPWIYDDCCDICYIDAKESIRNIAMVDTYLDESKPNAALIARSRTLLSEMAAEIERLEAELSTEREKSRIMRPIVLDGQSAENFCHVVELSELREESQRLQSELDAAKNDMRLGGMCESCVSRECNAYKHPCYECVDGSLWKWRGMCSENSAEALVAMKEDAHG